MSGRKRGKHGITLREYRQRIREFLPCGEQCANHILTESQVRAIRENVENKSTAQWGRDLGIPRGTIRDAKNYKTWKHVK